MVLPARLMPNRLKHLARKWMNRLAFESKLRIATPVLVFQMGKVGSLSVHESLRRQHPGNVVHTHRFTADHDDSQVRRLFRWAFLQARPLDVISLTREPVSRNISAFFQNLERETGSPFAESRFSLEELRTIFLERYDHELPLEWFDRNIRAIFGIDVFATPFPACGVETYERGKVRLLVIRSEIDDTAKVRAIGDFLGLPAFRLVNTNVGADKEYADVYRAFKSQVQLPREYVERMRGSKYFRHFYAA
jgi:Putative capsular polysaccharide synthesis protein